jgi:hypothetical protein
MGRQIIGENRKEKAGVETNKFLGKEAKIIADTRPKQDSCVGRKM